MAPRHTFDGRRVVALHDLKPPRGGSAEDREAARMSRERTVRILLEDGDMLDVPRGSLEASHERLSPEEEARLLEVAEARWAERRGELAREGLVDRSSGERLDVTQVAFARYAAERADEG